MNEKMIPPEVHEQIRRDRAAIAAELPELEKGHARMVEAKQEDTFCGQLRRVIHNSGREVAADAGIPSQHLVEFLEGTRTLRSDVLERILQAVAAEVVVSPRNKA